MFLVTKEFDSKGNNLGTWAIFLENGLPFMQGFRRLKDAKAAEAKLRMVNRCPNCGEII
jgi:hypothetical protein